MMLFIAIVPLMVHIFSIENYSDFVIENDRKNKEEILRSMIINSTTNVQVDNTVLISDLIAHDEEFTSVVNSGNVSQLSAYLENLMEETFIVKNIITVVGLAVFDAENNMKASYGNLNFAPGVIKSVLEDQSALSNGEKYLPRKHIKLTWRLSQNS